MQDQLVYSWYEQYRVGLYRFALSILKDAHLAEDALQEAFVRLLGQSSPPEPDKIQAWLYRVVRNICYDTLRKRKRETGEEAPAAAPREGNWEFIELISPPVPEGAGDPGAAVHRRIYPQGDRKNHRNDRPQREKAL